ncbi:tumor suppressor p53-binding protein [Anaeramoeba ignava]|uniref:Tumor suppressor p53-binding protein n=1 Tax=Anaeramoeba ignava TaxID=1746090 RepID=A0A9Q0RDB5_ANAIG|nr:tumor suppressor p53-binding protein [Anaeramoeba ignava]
MNSRKRKSNSNSNSNPKKEKENKKERILPNKKIEKKIIQEKKRRQIRKEPENKQNQNQKQKLLSNYSFLVFPEFEQKQEKEEFKQQKQTLILLRRVHSKLINVYGGSAYSLNDFKMKTNFQNSFVLILDQNFDQVKNSSCQNFLDHLNFFNEKNIPIIESKWVNDCIQEKKLICWKKYQIFF